MITLRNETRHVAGLNDAVVPTRVDQIMAEHDALPPALRDLQNYGPIAFRIGPGARTMTTRQIIDLFWRRFSTFRPIARDPLVR